MIYKTLKITIPLILFLLFSGCATSSLNMNQIMASKNTINVLQYPHRVTSKIDIPPACKSLYTESLPSVAVIAFENHTTYGKATINYKDKKQSAQIGLLGLSIGAQARNKNYNEKREVDAKLSQAITGPLETLILNNGGAKLFSREDMDKVDSELKLQDSGLLNPDTIVEFGQSSGVRYIITGSIDSVEESYRDHEGAAKAVNSVTARSDNKTAQVVGLLGRVLTSFTDGLTLKTKVTVKMIDVQTNKIVMTKKIEGEKFIGKLKRASFDQVTGGIKATIIESLPQIESELTNYFDLKAYVTQIRAEEKDSDNIIAQINLGETHKITQNQLFDAYNLESYQDPITNKESCDLIKIPVQLKISDQITKEKSWATVEGETSLLKVGHLLKKAPKE